VIRRNRRDLIRNRETEPMCYSPMDDVDPPVAVDASVQKCALSVPVSQSPSTSAIPSSAAATSYASVSPSGCASAIPTLTSTVTSSPVLQPAVPGHVPVTTRTGRVSLPPARFKDYVL